MQKKGRHTRVHAESPWPLQRTPLMSRRSDMYLWHILCFYNHWATKYNEPTLPLYVRNGFSGKTVVFSAVAKVTLHALCSCASTFFLHVTALSMNWWFQPCSQAHSNGPGNEASTIPATLHLYCLRLQGTYTILHENISICNIMWHTQPCMQCQFIFRPCTPDLYIIVPWFN